MLSTRTNMSKKPTIPLRLLPNSPGRCMDGSPPGYYLDRAPMAFFDDNNQRTIKNENATKWILQLEGGGECGDAKHCMKQLKGNLGSSKYFQPKIDDMPLIGSKYEKKNPYFWRWNRVYLKYCSQDLHSGKNGKLTVWIPTKGGRKRKTDLRFMGHEIVNNIVDDLVSRFPGKEQFSEIILTGGSAGGLGVSINLEFIARKFPYVQKIVGAPVAGFYFFAYPYMGPGSTEGKRDLSDFRAAAWPDHYKMWDSHVDSRCAAANPNHEWACLLPNISNAYIQEDMFFTEAQTDSVQLEGHDWIPHKGVMDRVESVLDYIRAWKSNMTQALHALGGRRGFFNPACYTHTSFTHLHGPFISQKSYIDAFAEWYAADDKAGVGNKFRWEDHTEIFQGDCRRDEINIHISSDSLNKNMNVDESNDDVENYLLGSIRQASDDPEDATMIYE